MLLKKRGSERPVERFFVCGRYLGIGRAEKIALFRFFYFRRFSLVFFDFLACLRGLFEVVEGADAVG